MSQTKVAIIGLGYVGLPLAVAFGKKLRTVGFDIDQERIGQNIRSFRRRAEKHVEFRLLSRPARSE